MRPPKIPTSEPSAIRWAREAKTSARAWNKLGPDERKYREDHAILAARNAANIPGDFPLELVASTASRLLQGNNYSDAVTRALGLLDNCKRTLSSNKEKLDTCLLIHQMAMDPEAEFDLGEGFGKLTFARALQRITGEKDKPYRAKEYFKNLLRRLNPSARPAEIDAIFTQYKNEGMEAAEVIKFAAVYASFRRRSDLSIRVEKKNLTRKSSPTRTKSRKASAIKSKDSAKSRAKPAKKRSRPAR